MMSQCDGGRSQSGGGPALSQHAPGRLALVALQLDVDDGAGSSAHRQLLPRLHLVAQRAEAAVRVQLELLLWEEGRFTFDRTGYDSSLYQNKSPPASGPPPSSGPSSSRTGRGHGGRSCSP